MNEVKKTNSHLTNRINLANNRVIIIRMTSFDNIQLDSIAQDMNFSYILFKDLVAKLSTKEGNFTDFPSFKDQLASIILSITTENKTKGVIVDQFDFSIISVYKFKMRFLQELKRYLLVQKLKAKIVLAYYGESLKHMFDSDFLEMCTIIPP
jgi:nitrogenase molybdenum-iron protein alpha/beta subunit